MSIHLDPKWRSELQRLVDAGEFGNLDEAVSEADIDDWFGAGPPAQA